MDGSRNEYIINEKHFNRLSNYLDEAVTNGAVILYGGVTKQDEKVISPTLIDQVSMDGQMMQNEIFGPILPILTYANKEEALAVIQKNPNPLAFYVFTENKNDEAYWLTNVPSGGACVNNATMHITNHELPFGGRGFSGLGGYHGKLSFDTFTHTKSVLKTPTWIDPSFKYPPYKGKAWLLKRLIG